MGREKKMEFTNLLPTVQSDFETVYVINRRLLLQSAIILSAALTSGLLIYFFLRTEKFFSVMQESISVDINDTLVTPVTQFISKRNVTRELYTIPCDDALLGKAMTPQTNQSAQFNRTLIQIVEWAIKRGAGSSQDLSHYYNISKNITDAILNFCVAVFNNTALCNASALSFYEESTHRFWPGSYSENISSAVFFLCAMQAYSETQDHSKLLFTLPIFPLIIAMAVARCIVTDKWNAKYDSLAPDVDDSQKQSMLSYLFRIEKKPTNDDVPLVAVASDKSYGVN